MALPIPIIVKNFGKIYEDQQKKDKQLKRKEEREKAMKMEKEFAQQSFISKRQYSLATN